MEEEKTGTKTEAEIGENVGDDRDKEGGDTERTQEMKKDRTRKMTGQKEERKTVAPEWKKERTREIKSRTISEQRR